MSILNEIVKQAGAGCASIAADIQEDNTFVDTGSYVFNALVSGSIFGGVSGNKITALAGESSTGKTFFAIAVVQNFLATYPDGSVVYFDSESAITKSLLTDRNIDTNRVAVVNIATIEEFRNIALKACDIHMKKPESERTPLLFVLDSLGMLSTTKEVTDILDDKQVRDMTKAQLVKGAFRVLTLACGRAKIPMIVTNHTYAVIGAYVPTKEMGGGCLVAGTKVQTHRGRVPIEDIQIGDYAQTMFGLSPVTETHQFDDKEVYEIEFEDGSIVRCSADHKFLVDCGDAYEWIETECIQEGFSLKSIDTK